MVDVTFYNKTGSDGQFAPLSARGAANGIAPLDAGARVPEANLPADLAATALSGTYVPFVTLAKNPDTLITGTITRNANEVVTSAAVTWPDGTAGTFTTDTIGTLNTIDAYHITYGSPTVIHTYTQPTITRDASGAATTVPAIVVT